MPKCGVCGWNFSDRTLTKHAYTLCGEESEIAQPRPHKEIDDIIKEIKEGEGDENA